ncbi:MAG: GNAT family N-acetyltransferase [Candidatus Gracilibacteria bacterium]
MKYFLKTKRLGFRKWHKGDIDIALKLWGDPEVTKLITAKGKLTKKDIEEKLAHEIYSEEEHGIQYWPIFSLETDENVGCCGLRPYDKAKNIYEIGFHIRTKFWRQGFASEAAKAIIKYAFDKLNISALFAGHNPKNEASKLLLKKLGFKYTHKEYYAPTGLDHPSYMLNKEKTGSPLKQREKIF